MYTAIGRVQALKTEPDSGGCFFTCKKRGYISRIFTSWSRFLFPFLGRGGFAPGRDSSDPRREFKKTKVYLCAVLEARWLMRGADNTFEQQKRGAATARRPIWRRRHRKEQPSQIGRTNRGVLDRVGVGGAAGSSRKDSRSEFGAVSG